MPEILKKNGVYTHLCSDHFHYWEDGGATYHTRYSSWECVRGQEMDPWKGVLGDVGLPEEIVGRDDEWLRINWVNRKFMQREEDMPQPMTFKTGRRIHPDEL